MPLIIDGNNGITQGTLSINESTGITASNYSINSSGITAGSTTIDSTGVTLSGSLYTFAANRPVFEVLGFQFKNDNGILSPTNKSKTRWFNQTDNTWVVPTGVNYIFVKMWGAGGGGGAYGGWRQGSHGGAGGFSHGIVPVVPGQTITIRPGGRGISRWGANKAYPDGGGASTGGGDNQYCAAGGGSSSIIVPSISTSACMYAGGGGGGGAVNGFGYNSGGAGGGFYGQPGRITAYTGESPGHFGRGGTQTSGGAAGVGSNTTGGAGSLGQGGTHQNTSCYGGGGGGGYYGGGSGAFGNGNSMGGGGGGSGYIHPNIIMGATYSGSWHIPPFYQDEDATDNGLYFMGFGGLDDGHGGPGCIVFYY